MTPDQIHPGHTYEMASGHEWTVLRRDGDLLRVRAPIGGEFNHYASGFARYAVRDITPAPESDQGEKVAHAQSQGASRGDGEELLPCPSAAAVNAELLEALRGLVELVRSVEPGVSERIDRARAAIARAEAGSHSHSRFRHRRTGDTYELLLIANEHAERTAQYPPTAVYRRVSDLTVWSRPVQDWGKDFEEVTGNE